MALSAGMSSSTRTPSDRIPKLLSSFDGNKYQVWKLRMETLLLALDLHSVVIHPVARGTMEDRSRSKGYTALSLREVDQKTVLHFLELGDAEGKEAGVDSSSSSSSSSKGKTKDASSSSSSSSSSTPTGGVDPSVVLAVKKKLVSSSLEAFGLLLNALDDSLVILFSDVPLGDANALWTKIERHFLQANSTTGEVAALAEDLAGVKMEEKKNAEGKIKLETVPEFVARIKAMMARLAKLGAPANEMNVMLRFIKAVEESGLKEFALDCQLARRDLRSGKVKTLDELTKDFLESRSTVVEQEKEIEDDAKRAAEWKQQNGKLNRRGGKDRRECFRCGKRGHLIKDCPQSDNESESESADSEEVECAECGGAGHVAVECPTRAKRKSAEKEKEKDRKEKSKEKESGKGKKKTDSAQLAVEADVAGRIVDAGYSYAQAVKNGFKREAKDGSQKLVMNVDSGSTVTILPTSRLLSSRDEKAKPIIIGTMDANAEKVRTTSTGSLSLGHGLVINRVAVVPTAAEPLLSVAALCDLGLRVVFLPQQGGVVVFKDGKKIMTGKRVGNRFELEVDK